MNVTVVPFGTVAVNPATVNPVQAVSHELVPLAAQVVYVTGDETLEDVALR